MLKFGHYRSSLVPLISLLAAAASTFNSPSISRPHRNRTTSPRSPSPNAHNPPDPPPPLTNASRP